LRNNIIHENGKETIERSVSFLESYDSEGIHTESATESLKGKGPMTVQEIPTATRMKTTETSTWSAPPEGWVKLNTDASFIGADKPSGAGAVARCSDGRVVLAACSPIATCDDAEDAEAKAALLGAKLMQGMCYDNIILETDCVAVASALRSNDINRSKQWSIYEETKLLLKNYRNVKINHVKRESNRVADALANIARSAGTCLWFDQPPDLVTQLVSEDYNVNSSPLMII
jgi:ribonuclease HI